MAGPPQAQAYFPDGTAIPNEKLAEAIQQGTAGYMPGSTVVVTNAAGQRFNVPAENMPEAFKQGWRPEAPAETHVKDVQAYEDAHPVATAFRSADEAFNSPGARAAFSEGVLEGDMPGTPLWSAHQAAKKFVPGYGAAAEAVKTAHPTAATLGQAAPLAAQMVGGGPGEAVMQLGAGALEETAPRAAAALAGRFATSTLGKAGQAAARTGFQGGFETAAYDAGQQAQQLALSDKEITSERLLASVGHIAESGALGTFLGTVLGGVGSLGKSGYEALGKSRALDPDILALKSFHMTPGEMKKMGKVSEQGLAAMSPEQQAAVRSDVELAKAYEEVSGGSSKLTEYERQELGAKIVGEELHRIPGAVSLKDVGERATLVGKAAEATGREEGDFIRALDTIAKPDVNEVKLAMRKYAQDLIDHGTGGDINAGRKLIRQYINRINTYSPITGELRGKEVKSFEDLFNFRKDDLRWKDTPGAVGKNYLNELNRVAEGAIEAEIAKLNAYAVNVPGKGWVITPGKPYELPKLSGVREVLGPAKPEVERLVAGGGVPGNLEAWAAYRTIKDRYSRLMLAVKTAERGARLEAAGKHGLTDILSIGTGIAEAASHGLGMGVATGVSMKAAAKALSPARRNAAMAMAMKAIQGGTDTTGIKLSKAVKESVSAGKTVAAETIKSIPKNTAKIASRYWDASDSARETSVNPEATANKIATVTAPLMDINPDVGRAVATKLTGDMNWLSKKLASGEFQIATLPQNGPAMAQTAVSGKRGKGGLNGPASRLSPSAMARFIRTADILTNPLGAIEKYSRTGRLPPELPEVLSERRPRIQAQLQSEYVNHIQELASKGQRQSYAGRVGGSLLTGMTLDSSMEPGPSGGVAFYQQTWATVSTGGDQSGEPSGDQGPKPSGMRGGRISDRQRDVARDRASAGEKAERDPGE